MDLDIDLTPTFREDDILNLELLLRRHRDSPLAAEFERLLEAYKREVPYLGETALDIYDRAFRDGAEGYR